MLPRLCSYDNHIFYPHVQISNNQFFKWNVEMNIKITTISGKVYKVSGDKIYTDRENGFYNISTYSHIDDYYVGIAKFRNKKILLSIYDKRIESIDYREENK